MHRSHRILIVDDDRQFIRLEERFLRDEFIVRSATSGAETLSLVPLFQPDLILLDVNMYEINGYETCRRLRENEDFRLIKIFMVSGRNSLEERLKGYEAGADDYVTKPFNRSEFLAKIRVALRLSRTEEIEKIKNSLLELLSVFAQKPTRNIIDLTGDLIENPKTPDHIWRHLGLIFRSAVELSHFVDKATRLHQLRQGKPLNFCSSNLQDHLVNVMRRWEPIIEHRKMRAHLDCPADITLEADWAAMDEVFGYILDNAVRYSDEGKEILITACERERQCIICFENSGKGIPAERIRNIFTPFSIDDIMHHHKGQGLSLSLAKRLIDLHQGKINVDSAPGEKTVFSILLPGNG